jgi:hypothetical protein
MSDFNYQEYLKNNPLLQKEVEENKLITESQEVDENLAEDKINENRPHPTEVFSDEELDYIGDMLVAMYEKLGLGAGGGETDVVKANALMDRIEGFFETLNEEKVTEEVTEEEIQEEVPSSKMKVSELKAKIKEDIISLLNEDEDEIDDAADEIEPDDAEVEVEDEVEADVEAPAPSAPAGLSSDEQDIQNSLKVAYDKAVAIGDEKLADQIGNSITFFTRSHVVER